jgi:hypothetical protein
MLHFDAAVPRKVPRPPAELFSLWAGQSKLTRLGLEITQGYHLNT